MRFDINSLKQTLQQIIILLYLVYPIQCITQNNQTISQTINNIDSLTINSNASSQQRQLQQDEQLIEEQIILQENTPNKCGLKSEIHDNINCQLIGTSTQCLLNDFLDLIKNTCPNTVTNISFSEFTINCNYQTFNVKNIKTDPTLPLFNILSFQTFEFENCISVYLASNQSISLTNINIFYRSLKQIHQLQSLNNKNLSQKSQQQQQQKQQSSKQKNNKLSQNIINNNTFINNVSISNETLLNQNNNNNNNKFKNNTFITQDKLQNQSLNNKDINIKTQNNLNEKINNKNKQNKITQNDNKDNNLKDNDIFDNIQYTMNEPTWNVIVQSQKIILSQNISCVSQLLLDGNEFEFDSNTNILSSQIAIYRELSNPPQNTPLNLSNINIKTFNINCLNSLEEAKKKMQYKSFFQIDFNKNISYINIPQFSTRSQLQAYMLDVLKNNFTMLIVTQSDSNLYNTTLSTSKLGYFANNILIDLSSSISTHGLGCPPDFGLGRGVIFGQNPPYICQASGAHHTSYGGIGLPIGISYDDFDDNDETNKQAIQQCYNNSKVGQYISESFPYDSLHITEGSGGGRDLDPIDRLTYYDIGGAGGGLVFIGAAQQMTHNGIIICDGVKGSEIGNGLYGGGGSGGSVKIMATNFMGAGNIYARGGDSSDDGTAGEGAGGIIDIIIQNTEQIVSSTYYYFTGLIDVSKGKRNLDIVKYPSLSQFLAQDGSMITPFCPAGYQELPRGTCTLCDNDEYKDTPYGTCQKCPSNDQEVFTQPNITAGLYCQANCDKIICDPFGFYISIVGPYGIFFLQATLSILTTGYVIRRIYRLKSGKIDHLPFDFEEATEQMRIDDQIITTDLQTSPEFIMSDLLFHTHRIQVQGTNTLNNYWKLSKIPPPEVEYIVNREQYKKFAERFNQTVKWRVLNKVVLVITSFLYYPLYWYLLTRVRKAVYKRAQKFFEQNELKIINMNVSGQFDKVQIKFSKSIDYTLCFFDIFDYKKSNFKYFFLNIPYFISLSGDGSFIKPININENDVFCKCLFFSINRNRKMEIVNERQRVMENLVNHKLRIDNSKKLNKFIQKFNRYTRSIDYMAPISLIQMSLAQTVELLNRWNEYFFNPNNVGCDLVVMEIPKKEGLKEMITVLANQEKDKFNQFIERIVNTIRYNNSYYEIKMYLFVYNLDSPTEVVAQTMDEQRIQLLTEGHILHQTVKESVLSQDLVTIKEKFQRKEILKIRQSSVHSRFSFVEDNEQSTKIEEIGMKRKTYKYIKRFVGFIRFCFFTHSPTTLSKHFLIFALTSLIVMDTIMTIPTIFNAQYAFTQMNKEKILYQDLLFLLLPYPFAVWISPILGLLLVTSQSYGIAKMYVIYNSMSLVDLIINVIWTFHDKDPPSTLPFVYSLKLITIAFRVMILYLASKYLSTAVKLTHLNSQKRSINL